MTRFVHLFAGAALLAAACSTQAIAPPLQHLDRPTDMTFTCVGSYSNGDGGVPVALPVEACTQNYSLPDAGPFTGLDASPSPINSATPFAFITESSRGDVSVANISNTGSFVDSDPFTPGLNGVPVGRLPVGITTSADGCYAVTANAGSCDLGLVNVLNATTSQPNTVSRVVVSNSAGPLGARPAAIVAPHSLPRPTVQPPVCTSPTGFVYIAFPSCQLVARVGLADGKIIDGMQFPPTGAPVAVGPDVTCPQTCASEADSGADAGVGVTPIEPSALSIGPDGNVLYVGSLDSPALRIINLDATGKPTTVDTVVLEGAIGITRIAGTHRVPMANNGPNHDRTPHQVCDTTHVCPAGDWRFAYVIGRDLAVHVVGTDLTDGGPPFECDTQIDRRFLKNNYLDLHRMSCFPVGDAANPPRRSDARGPGLRLPRNLLPLDVTFVYSLCFQGQPNCPAAPDVPVDSTANSVFSVISTLGPITAAPRGSLFYGTIDDDNYVDLQAGFKAADGSAIPMLEFGMPHALRDGADPTSRLFFEPNCTDIAFPAGTTGGPPRIDGDPSVPLGFITNIGTAVPGDIFAPSLHRVLCNPALSMWELDMAAPADVRGPLFADIDRINSNESFTVEWEGKLNPDPNGAARTGGRITFKDASTLRLDDPGGLNCKVGVEQGDMVELIGCTGDGDCDLGEVCFSHPDAPAGLTGMCFPKAQVADLSATCREVLISARRYSITDVASDWVTMVPRSRLLTSTPFDGCQSTQQCVNIQERELSAIEASQHVTLPRRSLTCEVDPSYGGPQRCVETCDSSKSPVDADAMCEPGSVCQQNRCVLGPMPPPECMAPLQHYLYRGGDVFTVLSSEFGYRSHVVLDSASGKCVQDTSQSPLIVGRFHRIEPACTGLDIQSTVPNPCSVPGAMEPYKDSTGTYQMRPTYAIRFRTPGLAFDVTDIGNALPENPAQLYGPYPTGYQIFFTLAGGAFPLAQGSGSISVGGLQLSLPNRVIRGLDESVWVVDQGDSPLIGGPLGQVVDVGISTAAANIRLTRRK